MVSHAQSQSGGKALIKVGAVESRSAGGGRHVGERDGARYSFNKCSIRGADTVKDERFRRDGPSRRVRRPRGIRIVAASALRPVSQCPGKPRNRAFLIAVGGRVIACRALHRVAAQRTAIRNAVPEPMHWLDCTAPAMPGITREMVMSNAARMRCFPFSILKFSNSGWCILAVHDHSVSFS